MAQVPNLSTRPPRQSQSLLKQHAPTHEIPYHARFVVQRFHPAVCLSSAWLH